MLPDMRKPLQLVGQYCSRGLYPALHSRQELKFDTRSYCCFFSLFRDDGVCPIDHESIEENEIFRDRAKRNEIRTLKCFCLYQDSGCVWTGKVCEVEVRARH